MVIKEKKEPLDLTQSDHKRSDMNSYLISKALSHKCNVILIIYLVCPKIDKGATEGSNILLMYKKKMAGYGIDSFLV